VGHRVDLAVRAIDEFHHLVGKHEDEQVLFRIRVQEQRSGGDLRPF
jgi:hypothetical protein